MNSNKVFIIKVKYDEMSHYSKVKRVFFSEETAVNYMNKEKLKDKNKGAFWIMSDREIEDYEPCLNDKDTELLEVEAIQVFIDTMIAKNKDMELNSHWDSYKFLEEQWALYEKRRIELES